MKIASPHCGFSPESNSGGETYEREILKNLAQLGVQFEIILAKGKSYPKGFSQFHIHELPIRKGLRWYVSNFIWPHYLKQIERSCGFDLLRIHSLRYTGPGIHWFNAHSERKYPVVCHHHHIDPNPFNFIDQKVANSSDLVITVSEFSKRQLINQYGLSPEKIRVIPNGVDCKFKPKEVDSRLAKEMGVDNSKILLYLGGLKKRKKLFFLIDVFELVRKKMKDGLKLIIAGSGPLERKLKNYAQMKLPKGSVIFTGYVAESQKVDFYNLCDIFIFPTSLEGFGFGAAEAMACGKPVIASNVGAVPEVVDDGKTGYLVTNEIHEFTEKIVYLLKNDQMRSEFGKCALEKTLKRYQWPMIAQKTLKTYEELLNGKSSCST